MTDADHCVGIPERSSEKFVCQHPNGTVQLEQAMVCEHGPDSLTRFPCVSSLSMRQCEECCVVHRFVSQTAECRMTMEDLDLLPDYDVPQVWQKGKELRKRC
jgi:hypothetical protein